MLKRFQELTLKVYAFTPEESSLTKARLKQFEKATMPGKEGRKEEPYTPVRSLWTWRKHHNLKGQLCGCSSHRQQSK
jgi:hypothetical protein